MEQPLALTQDEARECVRRHRGRVLGVAFTLLGLAAVFYGLALVRM
ncbi:hypothetical protein HLH36_05740 [Gluconacetobacter aggeris]|uniref:Uncharacterized protein n=2 Tax=Gluconacetobacter TaxID=89583 RepID=A0A7W4NVQ6_9PROT|nr:MULTISPECIES: hypothetical protein [Gluconacetobacter]MBB2167862.1 hypothetical protein [Gluconacetobacter aggeris]MBB2179070.1 hypothetical protein [Gluconacetobacter tumulicola]